MAEASMSLVRTRYPRSAPSPAPAQRAPGRVREPATSFHGRARELRVLADWFAMGGGLLTLTGAPGCGKSRLAQRFVALCEAEREGDGWMGFCDLSEAHDAAAAMGCLARALGVASAGEEEGAAALAQLAAALRLDPPALVVLDNCEHVLRDVARVVEALGDAAPRTRILATSRERLAVTGERLVEVHPLSVPEREGDAPASEAVQLFVDRARLVQADYSIADAQEASFVASIVRALDGIPLAVEMAAARMALMSARTLLSRLGNRFELLVESTGGTRDRRSTLRASLDGSWDRLEPWEKAALRQLAVFQGGFSLEAAEAVVQIAQLRGAPTVLDAVQRLRDKSLVHARPTLEMPAEPRLDLYRSIGAYVIDKLDTSGEIDSATERHARYFLHAGADWAEQARRGSPEGARALRSETENLAAAHFWALQRSPSDMLRAALALDTALSLTQGPRACLEMLD